MNRVLWHLRQVAREGGPLTDGQLLDRYLLQRDEGAFEALVCRHGPMVLGVCRRVLRNLHEAEDAFQATFLVLVRKAGSITPRDRVGNWLYGVAWRTALKSRQRNLRRQSLEKPCAVLDEAAAREDSTDRLQEVLDQELQHLPAKYRLPVLLCALEGKSRKEAARQLGWPEGTVATRLTRGRDLLARRLRRHGLPLAAGWAGALAQAASAAIPATLLRATVKAALIFSAKRLPVGLVPAGIADLAREVLTMLVFHKLKMFAVTLLALASLGLGVILLHANLPGPSRADKDDPPAKQNLALVPAEKAQDKSKPAETGADPKPNKQAPEDPKPAPVGESGTTPKKQVPKKAGLGLDFAAGSPTGREEIEAVLASPINVTFDGAPFSEVLQYLKTWSNLNIVLDDKSFQESGISLDFPIKVDLKKVTLKTALKHILAKAGMTYYVEDGVVLVAKEDSYYFRKIYPVADLVGTSAEDPAKDLVRVITKTIAEPTWSSDSGRGAIEYFPATKCLIVLQITAVQDDIQQLLEELRKVKKATSK